MSEPEKPNPIAAWREIFQIAARKQPAYDTPPEKPRPATPTPYHQNGRSQTLSSSVKIRVHPWLSSLIFSHGLTRMDADTEARAAVLGEGAMPTPSNVGMFWREDPPPATDILNHQNGRSQIISSVKIRVHPWLSSLFFRHGLTRMLADTTPRRVRFFAVARSIVIQRVAG